MPKQEGQKSKLLTLLRILEQKTDEEHLLNVPQLVQLLEQQGIFAERKSIYSDIDTLRSLGYDIQLQRGRGGGYWPAAPLSCRSSNCWWTPCSPARSSRPAPATSSSTSWKPCARTTKPPNCSARCMWTAAPKPRATPCCTASTRCTVPSARAKWCALATRAAPAPSARGSWRGRTAAITSSPTRTRKSRWASATIGWTACPA